MKKISILLALVLSLSLLSACGVSIPAQFEPPVRSKLSHPTGGS